MREGCSCADEISGREQELAAERLQLFGPPGAERQMLARGERPVELLISERCLIRDQPRDSARPDDRRPQLRLVEVRLGRSQRLERLVVSPEARRPQRSGEVPADAVRGVPPVGPRGIDGGEFAFGRPQVAHARVREGEHRMLVSSTGRVRIVGQPLGECECARNAGCEEFGEDDLQAGGVHSRPPTRGAESALP